MVEYTIEYTVHSDGIILYKFYRKVLEKKPSTVPALEKSYDQQRSKDDAVTEIVLPSYQPEISDEQRIIDLIIAYTTFAATLEATHAKINSNSETYNSFSAAIVAACNTFLMKVASLDLTSASGIQAAKMSIYDFELAIETYLGEEYLEEILEALESEDEETLNKLISNIQDEADEYDESTKTKPNRDPLVIDLGTKGIELTDVLNGVNFDLDNNGFAEKTAWIGTEDGFLAYDRNRNGIIDNGGELFGDQVVLSNGLKSTSGFESLSELDSNKDLIIDKKDSKFKELLVWIDSNHNGVSDAEELFSLTDLGIISISLEHENVRSLDKKTGTLKSESANVVINIDGNVTETEISEFWFEINTTNTTQNGKVTAGNVPDIKDIILSEENGEVYDLLCKFGDSDSIAEKHYYVKQILYHITGATDIAYNNRGGNIDARELKVIEEFMGREFVGVDGNNPNGRAATILKSIYSNIENKYYNILNMYCGLGGYLKIVYEYEDEAGDKLLNLSLLNWLFTEKINSGENIDYLIYDLGLYLIYYDEINGTHYYDEYCEYYSNLSADIATIVAMTGNCRTYIGTEGNDVFYGTEGNDVIVGDGGNDVLRGDIGNDAYIFDIGDGVDSIQDYENSTIEGKEDTIVFGEGISPKDVLIQKAGSNLIIQYTETDIITVERVYDNDAGKFFVENIHFADGTKWSKEDIIDKASVRYGTDTADRISGYVETSIYSNDEIIYGGAGNDTIGGACGQDELYGEEGNDTLRGGIENDVLVGGVGNDTLSGDEGNDTYIFEIGDGVDAIQDYENSTTEGKEDTIVFGEGISPENVLIQKKGSNLVIEYTETDCVTVERVYDNNAGCFFVENIHFADGTKWSKEDIIDKARTRYGTEAADNLSGYARTSIYSNDEIIYGEAGNDTIGGSCGQDELYGGVGNDILLGGTGNDVIVGGVGNDTLRGEEGNDTYIFEIGDGVDVIQDYENSSTAGKQDTIVFGAGISLEDVLLLKSGTNLVIQYTEADCVTVENAYSKEGYSLVEYIHFSDGTIINSKLI